MIGGFSSLLVRKGFMMTQNRNICWSEETAKKSNKNQSVLWKLRCFVSDLSVRKIVRLGIVLAMSVVCWLGVGCVALELLQLATH
jgi:hypothetical protein